ncbi:uncharacterized protein TRAVEDRAFT_47090 [Trametes versicolor FP-101664 SS1]|uniref:uncharacterized protein n=1 Tax=Trametes versicolor (strain FP-101664) TaxID=717944 RepID=UPI0004622ED3|nr:uncharacterized protein TRAVEDRAFT_47090 [Trametes versicolor FP-101664 SS1]EIW59786.1 hypothetical protein TRAVEDRAFT_47090 [Trametes versicolor FP-101664 SS1]
MYGMSCVRYQPFESTDAALAALISRYNVPVAVLVLATSEPLNQLVLFYAPHRPIDAYALAAHHGFEEIAIALAVKIGPIYLSWLCTRQQSRLYALRNIVLRPPADHPPTPKCTKDVRREL